MRIKRDDIMKITINVFGGDILSKLISNYLTSFYLLKFIAVFLMKMGKKLKFLLILRFD
jgi:hypothetical protein